MNGPRVPVVERAYALAREPECQTVGQLWAALAREGYSQADLTHFQGASIRADLQRLCRLPKAGADAPSKEPME